MKNYFNLKHYFAGLIALAIVSFAEFASAQLPRQYLDISVLPDKPDWTYQLGENVKFIVSVTQSGRPISVENVRYFVKEEKKWILSKRAH